MFYVKSAEESSWVTGFPSPREVDRFLYLFHYDVTTKDYMFPSPLEVDRFLYFEKISINAFYNLFPAPLEVDRFLYLLVRRNL